ncbi:hypothetical protein [Candidatus Ichthyocystis sparus]|nr:hypothetical protein [Candidatus Ichthyocystis sparus]
MGVAAFSYVETLEGGSMWLWLLRWFYSETVPVSVLLCDVGM